MKLQRSKTGPSLFLVGGLLKTRVKLQGSKTSMRYMTACERLKTPVKLQGSKTLKQVVDIPLALKTPVKLQGLSERKTKSEQKKKTLIRKNLIKVFYFSKYSEKLCFCPLWGTLSTREKLCSLI